MSEQKQTPERILKAAETRKANTLMRYKMIQDQYIKMYDIKRTRYDDCIKDLSRQFALSPAKIEMIVKMDLD
jgi:hypothetical protein